MPKIKSINTWINEFNTKHNNKYSYSKMNYTYNYIPIEIICPIHNSFWQKPMNHKRGNGCPKCDDLSRYKNTTQSIIDFRKVHKDKYDYSKVNYKNAKSKVIIICPIHLEFEQTPNNHLDGQGCPKCNEKKGERIIRQYLEENNILFNQEYKLNNNQRLDFFLEDYNLGIEFDGVQHSKPINFWGGEKEFIKNQERDQRKNLYCKDNDINLLRIPYLDMKNIDKVLKEKLNPLKFI